MNRVAVVGIGYRPLDGEAKRRTLEAPVILGSRRLCEVFERYAEFGAVKDRVRVINRVDETLAFLRGALDGDDLTGPLVLLASGDPLFYGIGRKVLQEFGHDRVEIFPDLSSVQTAFARIGEPWDDAFLMSLHGGPDPEKRRRLPYEMKDIPALLGKHRKLAILTDRENSPSAIAAFLQAEQVSAVDMHVCERLGYPEERISSGRPEELGTESFGEPNVVIVIKKAAEDAPPPPCFGLTEGDLAHSRGLITKDEVRAVTIHKLRLPRRGVFWDVGAGSGSISIEAARLNPGLRVYAVEKNGEQIANSEANLKRYGLANVTVVRGEAPESLKGLPAPDRIFVGGASGHIREIATLAAGLMPQGIIVINAVTLDTLHEALSALEAQGFRLEISEVSVSRSKKIGDKLHMSALNPVFIIKGEKAAC